MDCRKFENAWNEWLDAGESTPAEAGRALESHAAACPTCQAVAARYRTLRAAIAASGPPPSPPAGFVERFLAAAPPAAFLPAPRPRLLRLRPSSLPIAAALAAAASLLVAGLVALRLGPVHPGGRPPVTTSARAVRAIDPHALGDALATATSATLELARETSAPAARIGREVFVPAGASAAETAPVLPSAFRVEPASDVLRGVGDRIHAGVGPLSGTARSAFGFLLGPAADAAGRDAAPDRRL